MYITLHLHRGASPDSEDAPTAAAGRDLAATAERLGVTLEPVHPDAHDPALRRYFKVEVADEQADRVLETLRLHDAVEAAYVKPADELP